MDESKLKIFWFTLALLLAPWLAGKVYAGGSGLNTVVVINQNSTNSIALANYFCERRHVPPENVLRITWSGVNTLWTAGDFQTNLLNPLWSMVAARRLTNQVDYVVLSMDIPFFTDNNSTNWTMGNGTTSAIFYGLKSDIGLAVLQVTNSYAASEQPFRQATPASASGPSFLTTMITAGTLSQAESLVDQGVNSDGTFPTQSVLLEKSSDSTRNGRYRTFDNAVFNTRLRGNYAMTRTNSDSLSGLSNSLGVQTGLYQFTISPGTFVPGAMADSMTSYGGVIFGNNDQTSLMALINAGAAGAYGTVTEPTPDLDKFPNPQNYFYQARGFSLAECYYQSLVAPYQGLIVGEPLAAPFRVAGTGTWYDAQPNASISGVVPLSAGFTAADAAHPLQQVDLFVDGKFARTLTNIAPQAGNALTVSLNSTQLVYTVPPGAVLGSIAAGLASLLNDPAITNVTRTIATAHGDRVELSSLATNRLFPPGNLRFSGGVGSPVVPGAPLVATGAGSAPWLSTFLFSSRPVFLNSTAFGIKACSVSGTVQIGTWLQVVVTKTNGAVVAVSVTNSDANGNPFTMTTQLVNAVNSTPSLQGPDGLVFEDLTAGWFNSGNFNCRALSPGLGAAAIRILFNCSGQSFVFTPPTESALNDGQYDLQPRNHLYVAAGVTNLSLSFPLDTTLLADGYHDLSLVAYEGTHVRTQTRLDLALIVTNSPLNATLGFLDLTDPPSAQSVYHVQVTANTNVVQAIHLFTTGGEFAVNANQSTATFTVDASLLGPGLHEFYAQVDTPSGPGYRTQSQWVRFGP